MRHSREALNVRQQDEAFDAGGKATPEGISEHSVTSKMAWRCESFCPAKPRLVHVQYFDTEVQKYESFRAGQPIKLTPVGGGGTGFRPCF
jgi:hypothetical protein